MELILVMTGWIGIPPSSPDAGSAEPNGAARLRSIASGPSQAYAQQRVLRNVIVPLGEPGARKLLCTPDYDYAPGKNEVLVD
jgi:hypothetical protein